MLSKPPRSRRDRRRRPPAGTWPGSGTCDPIRRVDVNHALHLRQKGNDLGGSHQGEFVTRELTGHDRRRRVRIRSAYGEQHGDSINLTFTGKVTGDQMRGTLDMGEYLGATWTPRDAPRRTAELGTGDAMAAAAAHRVGLRSLVPAP